MSLVKSRTSTPHPVSFVVSIIAALWLVSNVSAMPLGFIPSEPKSAYLDLPDFGAMEDVTQKKQTFFEYMLTHASSVNAEIKRNRARLLKILEDADEPSTLSLVDRIWLNHKAQEYELNEFDFSRNDLVELKKRMDIVPASLALAQSANESAWGTSRFATEGNNLFGIWCYTPGCGIIPKKRPSSASYEVAKFTSVRESLKHYMKTLNTHNAYRSFREKRYTLRKQGKEPKGLQLVGGLKSYSERGVHYVNMIASLIKHNQLSQLDQQ